MLLPRILILCHAMTLLPHVTHAHEVVYPRVNYAREKVRVKRSAPDESANDIRPTTVDKSKLDVKFSAMGREFHAKLKLNKRLFAPNFNVEVLGKDGAYDHTKRTENCFYTGKLEDENNSLVSLTSCNGLKGIIQTSTDKYSIQPFVNATSKTEAYSDSAEKRSETSSTDISNKENPRNGDSVESYNQAQRNGENTAGNQSHNSVENNAQNEARGYGRSNADDQAHNNQEKNVDDQAHIIKENDTDDDDRAHVVKRMIDDFDEVIQYLDDVIKDVENFPLEDEEEDTTRGRRSPDESMLRDDLMRSSEGGFDGPEDSLALLQDGVVSMEGKKEKRDSRSYDASDKAVDFEREDKLKSKTIPGSDHADELFSEIDGQDYYPKKEASRESIRDKRTLDVNDDLTPNQKGFSRRSIDDEVADNLQEFTDGSNSLRRREKRSFVSIDERENEDEEVSRKVKRSLGETEGDVLKEGFCGIGDDKPHVRWSRDLNGIKSNKVGEQTIETMLVVDQKMTQYYGLDAAKQYALTVANAAHGILRDSTIGPNTLNLVITKLLILTTPLDDLNVNHHARNSLASFGRWADKRNNADIGHPDHYDYAVLLTKHDICVDMNQPCETKGLSIVGGMCDRARSAAIIEDNGFASSFTLAHQTGHSLGMDHDGVGNNCDNGNYVMSKDGGRAADAFHWSPCSIDYLQQFLRSAQSQCLLNDPPISKRATLEVYGEPGVVYDAHSQCRYALGEQARACFTGKDQSCSELLCYHPENATCQRMKNPVLDGTPCGENQWCKSGRCVYSGVRGVNNVVDGGWSLWSEMRPCSRSCGGGVSFRERVCNQPKPDNGGKFCEGNARDYVLCNQKQCERGLGFRQLQCESKPESFVGDTMYNWTYPHISQVDPACDLVCTSRDRTVKHLFGHAQDGTECIVGNIPGRCVRGECNTVGCDLELGSSRLNDRCGVCGGDGGLCSNHVDLSTNPVAVARHVNTRNVIEKLHEITNNRSLQEADVPQNRRLKIGQLRSIMNSLSEGDCGGDPQCIAHDVSKDFSKRGFSTQQQPITFEWVQSSLGCSSACGKGTEILRPECRRVDDRTSVSESYCDVSTKPNTVSRSCGSGTCQPSWSPSVWSDCTRSCRGGVRTRSIDCVLRQSGGPAAAEMFVLPPAQCNTTRPRHLEACNLHPCPPEWHALPFGPCSTLCGRGVRTRHVVCRSKQSRGKWTTHLKDTCSHLQRPQTESVCNEQLPCPGDGQCGGRFVKPSGEIHSPSYPLAYPNHLRCMDEINLAPGNVVRLAFNTLEIGAPGVQSGDSCKTDYLQVVDGRCNDVTTRPLFKFCGRTLPSEYTSSGETLCLMFVSSEKPSAATARGFSVNYTSIEKRNEKPVLDVCDVKDQVITSPLGIMTSPNYPRKYPRNENCRVTFVSPDESGYLLKIDAFDVGTSRRSGVKCRNDYVQLLYDENTQMLCGNKPATQTIRIPSTEFTLNFHAASRHLDSKGFVVTFTTEEYAMRNGIDIKEHHFKDLSDALVEWHNNLHNTTTATPSHKQTPFFTPYKLTVLPNEEVKKSAISLPNDEEQGQINDRRELVNVLLQLARFDPKRFSTAVEETNERERMQAESYTPSTSTEIVKKSDIPRPPVDYYRRMSARPDMSSHLDKRVFSRPLPGGQYISDSEHLWDGVFISAPRAIKKDNGPPLLIKSFFRNAPPVQKSITPGTLQPPQHPYFSLPQPVPYAPQQHPLGLSSVLKPPIAANVKNPIKPPVAQPLVKAFAAPLSKPALPTNLPSVVKTNLPIPQQMMPSPFYSPYSYPGRLMANPYQYLTPPPYYPYFPFAQPPSEQFATARLALSAEQFATQSALPPNYPPYNVFSNMLMQTPLSALQPSRFYTPYPYTQPPPASRSVAKSVVASSKVQAKSPAKPPVPVVKPAVVVNYQPKSPSSLLKAFTGSLPKANAGSLPRANTGPFPRANTESFPQTQTVNENELLITMLKNKLPKLVLNFQTPVTTPPSKSQIRLALQNRPLVKGPTINALNPQAFLANKNPASKSMYAVQHPNVQQDNLFSAAKHQINTGVRQINAINKQINAAGGAQINTINRNVNTPVNRQMNANNGQVNPPINRINANNKPVNAVNRLENIHQIKSATKQVNAASRSDIAKRPTNNTAQSSDDDMTEKDDLLTSPTFTYVDSSKDFTDDLTLFGGTVEPGTAESAEFIGLDDPGLERKNSHGDQLLPKEYTRNLVPRPNEKVLAGNWPLMQLPGGNIPLSKLTLNDVLKVERLAKKEKLESNKSVDKGAIIKQTLAEAFSKIPPRSKRSENPSPAKEPTKNKVAKKSKPAEKRIAKKNTKKTKKIFHKDAKQTKKSIAKQHTRKRRNLSRRKPYHGRHFTQSHHHTHRRSS